MHTTDVIVVGGGVVGSSIAWRVALTGERVTVVEPEPGSGASWAAAGMLAPVTELHYGEQGVLALGAASLARYPSFVAELEDATGQRVGYRASGTLIVAKDPDDLAALGDLWRFQSDLGLEVERLTVREARALEPALSPRMRGAWHVAGDHHVDNRALADALIDAAKGAGAEVISGRVTELLSADDRATGVRLEDGSELGAPTVVLAAGCWSASIDGIPPRARPPVRPVKGQLLYLRGPAAPALMTRNVRGVEVYIVPRSDGRVVVGATVEERGFDTTVTAGALYALLQDAFELVPGLAELELIETVAGLRPGSPDNAPIIGPTALDGLIVATGHYRNGILLTPLTADAVVSLITTGAMPEIMVHASPARFGETP